MKKKRFFITIGLAICSMMAAFNIYSNTNNSTIPDLALANIEALAQNEGGSGSDCTVIGYKEIWSEGCLYQCAQCKEGYFKALYIIRCLAR